MIPQPKSYREYCKKFHTLTPMTMFNMRETESDNLPAKYPYQVGDTNIPGTMKGRIELLYVLKSFPKPHDNSRYRVFVLARNGLYVEEITHAQVQEPIDFRSMFLKFVKPVGSTGTLIINKPDSRLILFLKNYTWVEKINGKQYPNSFDSSDMKDIKTHSVVIKSPDYKDPIETEVTPELLHALRTNRTYLHLRADNYVPFSGIIPYHPRY